MLRVTCAVIRNVDDRVLVVRHGDSGSHPWKWEFPGGKVELGETDEDCIVREIDEELKMDIVICDSLPEVAYDYGFKQITLIPFVCDTLALSPVLTEHVEYKWMDVEDILDVDLCEADILVAEKYRSYIQDTGKILKKQFVDEEQYEIDDELVSSVKNIMSSQQAEWIASTATYDTTLLDNLVKLSFFKDEKAAFHASWIVSKVADDRPDLMDAYVNYIAGKVVSTDNDGVLRMHLHTISKCNVDKIDEDKRGTIIDRCFSLMKSDLSSVSMKTNSMDVLYKFSVIYPDLENELISTINMVITDGTPGIVSRGKAILKKLHEC